MEKYRFDRKLQEAVLRRNEGQQLTIIIDGEERKARYPAFVGTSTRDISCLVEKVRETGNTEYNVVAVSFDNLDEKEKNWICIQPVFLEQAIEFFMENYQMESMTGDCKCAERLPDTKDSGFDFETKNTLVEIKVLIPVTDGTHTCIWKGFHQAVKQMIGFSNNFAGRDKAKRIILLTICQDGTEQIKFMADGNIEELGKAVKAGIEFWIAETKTNPDGIELLSYCDITCNILNG